MNTQLIKEKRRGRKKYLLSLNRRHLTKHATPVPTPATLR